MLSVDFGIACDPSVLLKTIYTSTKSNIVDLSKSGIETAVLKSRIAIYPNPTSHEINVQLNSKKLIGSNYSIIDNIGRVVKFGVLTNETNAIDLVSLPAGIYFMKVGNESSQAFKIFKQ
jgi:hypothetical protein